MARKHSSQFHYEGENADTAPFRPSFLDRDVQALLRRYPILPSNWITAFVGGNEIYNARRYARLAREPHNLLIRYQAWYKHATYALKHHEHSSTEDNPHKTLQALAMASIELAARNDAEVLLWDDIVALGNVPQSTLDMRDPHRIPLLTEHSKGDVLPFILRKGGRDLAVLTIEIDRHTEPKTSSTNRRTIEQKMEHYQEIFKRKLWRSHYGFPNSIVIFLTISKPRMHAIMEQAKATIGDASWLCFAHTRDWGQSDPMKKNFERHYPPAPGQQPLHDIEPFDLYHTPLKRNGHPDFRLDKFDTM